MVFCIGSFTALPVAHPVPWSLHSPASSFLFPTRGPLTPEPLYLLFPSTVHWPLRSCSLPSLGQASAETPAPLGILSLTPVPLV